MKTVASHALGCKVNQYESEAIAELFQQKEVSYSKHRTASRCIYY